MMPLLLRLRIIMDFAVDTDWGFLLKKDLLLKRIQYPTSTLLVLYIQNVKSFPVPN